MGVSEMLELNKSLFQRCKFFLRVENAEITSVRAITK